MQYHRLCVPYFIENANKIDLSTLDNCFNNLYLTIRNLQICPLDWDDGLSCI